MKEPVGDNPVLEGVCGLFHKLEPTHCHFSLHEPGQQGEAVRGLMGRQHRGGKDVVGRAWMPTKGKGERHNQDPQMAGRIHTSLRPRGRKFIHAHLNFYIEILQSHHAC